MLHQKKLDVILDNPFTKIGLNGVSLKDKSVSEAVSLARTVVRVIRASERIEPSRKLYYSKLADMLNDAERAKTFLRAIAGLTPEQILNETLLREEAQSERKVRSFKASFAYHLDRTHPPSLTNAIRLPRADIELVDIISLLQSPLSPDDKLASKLFSKKITCLGEGLLQGGAVTQNIVPTERQIVGVFNLKAREGIISPKLIRDMLDYCGIINAPSQCIEHRSIGEGPSTVLQTRDPLTHPVYSHFHPIEALNRLVLIEEDTFRGQFSARIPATRENSCNLLISRVNFGSSYGICIEGIITAITPHQIIEQKGQTKEPGTKIKAGNTTSPSIRSKRKSTTKDQE